MQYPFLALLTRAPAHGYELKQALDQTFGPLWPELNLGQVYTTLAHLEQDGLIQGQAVAHEHRRDQNVYEVTAAGRETLGAWIEAPWHGPWVKNEFFLKLTIAWLTGLADPLELIARQRLIYLQALHEVNRSVGTHPVPAVASASDPGTVAAMDGDTIAALVMEGAALHLEADLKWLDACERAFAADASRVLEPAGQG